MFIDVDYKKRILGAKLHLGRPNKVIISNIFEAFDKNLSIKMGDINELNFSIPYYVENVDGDKLIKNKHIEEIREKMLIRVTMEGYREWFIVEDIEEEESDNVDKLTVTAYSLGYELKRRMIDDLEEEAINIVDLTNIILQNTLWKVREIDSSFLDMYRSFSSGNNSNSLNSLIDMAETFGALIVWHTDSREISLKNPIEMGRFTGLNVDYGRLLSGIKKSRMPEEMVTRLYVTGNEGLSIQRVNPTGERYLEDFSYFMYPFERNSRGVVRSSYFMSDDLCNAILDHEELLESHSQNIKSLISQREDKQQLQVIAESNLNQAQMELENILELLDIAKSTNDQVAIDVLNLERSNKETDILTLNEHLINANLELSSVVNQIDAIYDSISRDSNFTEELLEELKYYIIESEWHDDNYIDEDELYQDGLKKFKEIREPKIIIEIRLSNLLNSVENQHYWDKLIIGDYIKVKYPIMNIDYKAKIIEMNFDLDENDVELVIANTEDVMNDQEKLVELLYSNKSATSLVENNKYKWDRINAVEKEVNDIITQEWDATKNRIIAGVRNSVKIGNRGIIVENPDFPNEILIMQSGVLALSKDKGETWKTAVTPDGIVAERLIGQIIAGQELIITNSAGTFTMDSNGFEVYANSFRVKSSSGDRNLVEEWNKSGDFVKNLVDDGMITPFEKNQLSEEWLKINLHHDYLSEIVYAYFDDVESMVEFLDFESTYSDLFDYLFVNNQTDGYPLLSPSNIDKTTRVDKEIFNLAFNNYRDNVTIIEKAISLKGRDLAQEAYSLAQSAKDDIEDIRDDIAYRVDITSTNGIVFKNNNIDTVIYARVFKGNDDITNTLPNSSFVWKKYDKDGILDSDWGDRHINVGNTIEVDNNDVFQKATFSCDVQIS